MKKKKDFRSKGPELLLDMQAHVRRILIETAALMPEKADAVAQEVTDKMAEHWGGQNVYFPMGLALKANRLAYLIYAEFDGSNQAELAAKHKKSVQWIYSLINQVRAANTADRAAELADRQPQLFCDADDEANNPA